MAGISGNRFRKRSNSFKASGIVRYFLLSGLPYLPLPIPFSEESIALGIVEFSCSITFSLSVLISVEGDDDDEAEDIEDV